MTWSSTAPAPFGWFLPGEANMGKCKLLGY